MSNVIHAIPRFARRTAEMCVGPWDRDTIIARMKRFPKSFEKEVVKAIEDIQLEELQKEDE